MINRIKEHFGFTKKELNGLIVFLFLIIAITFFPFIYSCFKEPEVYNFDDFKKEIAAFEASAVKEEDARYYKKYDKRDYDKPAKPEYFSFNPNELPEESWKRLGLKLWQIRMIKNYESKGGKFYKKEDLQRIYSIRPEDYARLEPYINIPANFSDRKFDKKIESGSGFKKKFETVDINSADSAKLETLKGIGAAFATRIIKYRNRLGGFHSPGQLMEVYGLDSAKYAALQGQISFNQTNLQKLNVNTISLDELKKHPYLTFKQANAIIQYRRQHGLYKSSEDLRKIIILPEAAIKKIEPYLAF